MTEKIKMGISSCLLGNKVRYDGGHKLDRFLKDTFGQFMDYMPVCPEAECGLDIPRESMRLVGRPESYRIITHKTKTDHTERMVKWANRKVRELQSENLCGFIFKSKSPSSGMKRVNVYTSEGVPVKKGTGIFARIFMDRFPLLPVEEEGRLHDPKLRENFIECIFAMKRWRECLSKGQHVGKLVEFHTREKLLILSHSQENYRLMGKLVAGGKSVPPDDLYNEYENLFMRTLKLKTTINKNINVLHHMMGYFKNHLSSDEKKEIFETVHQYKNGFVPLIVPMTLLKHYVRKYQQPYLETQTYLNPHPTELQLRNHV